MLLAVVGVAAVEVVTFPKLEPLRLESVEFGICIEEAAATAAAEVVLLPKLVPFRFENVADGYGIEEEDDEEEVAAALPNVEGIVRPIGKPLDELEERRFAR